ncbi:MAG: hypothetical protein ACYC9L_03010 [Sulfuricaulis sp.]
MPRRKKIPFVPDQQTAKLLEGKYLPMLAQVLHRIEIDTAATLKRVSEQHVARMNEWAKQRQQENRQIARRTDGNTKRKKPFCPIFVKRTSEGGIYTTYFCKRNFDPELKKAGWGYYRIPIKEDNLEYDWRYMSYVLRALSETVPIFQATHEGGRACAKISLKLKEIRKAVAAIDKIRSDLLRGPKKATPIGSSAKKPPDEAATKAKGQTKKQPKVWNQVSKVRRDL